MANEMMVIDCPECGEILHAPQCRPGACGLVDGPQPNLSAAVQTLEKALEEDGTVGDARVLKLSNAIQEALAHLPRQRGE